MSCAIPTLLADEQPYPSIYDRKRAMDHSIEGTTLVHKRPRCVDGDIQALRACFANDDDCAQTVLADIDSYIEHTDDANIARASWVEHTRKAKVAASLLDQFIRKANSSPYDNNPSYNDLVDTIEHTRVLWTEHTRKAFEAIALCIEHMHNAKDAEYGFYLRNHSFIPDEQREKWLIAELNEASLGITWLDHEVSGLERIAQIALSLVGFGNLSPVASSTLKQWIRDKKYPSRLNIINAIDESQNLFVFEQNYGSQLAIAAELAGLKILGEYYRVGSSNFSCTQDDMTARCATAIKNSFVELTIYEEPNGNWALALLMLASSLDGLDGVPDDIRTNQYTRIGDYVQHLFHSYATDKVFAIAEDRVHYGILFLRASHFMSESEVINREHLRMGQGTLNKPLGFSFLQAAIYFLATDLPSRIGSEVNWAANQNVSIQQYVGWIKLIEYEVSKKWRSFITELSVLKLDGKLSSWTGKICPVCPTRPMFKYNFELRYHLKRGHAYNIQAPPWSTWDDLEISVFRHLVTNGVSLQHISRLIGRTYYSCSKRTAALGFKQRPRHILVLRTKDFNNLAVIESFICTILESIGFEACCLLISQYEIYIKNRKLCDMVKRIYNKIKELGSEQALSASSRAVEKYPILLEVFRVLNHLEHESHVAKINVRCMMDQDEHDFKLLDIHEIADRKKEEAQLLDLYHSGKLLAFSN